MLLQSMLPRWMLLRAYISAGDVSELCELENLVDVFFMFLLTVAAEVVVVLADVAAG